VTEIISAKPIASSFDEPTGMFYRLAMWSIRARAGISTDKIGARGQCWSSRFSVSGRNNLKLELQRVRGSLGLDELTSCKWLGIGNG